MYDKALGKKGVNEACGIVRIQWLNDIKLNGNHRPLYKHSGVRGKGVNSHGVVRPSYLGHVTFVPLCPMSRRCSR